MLNHINAQIDAIANDHLRGASEIVDSIYGLFFAIAELYKEAPGSGNKLFRRAVRRLVRGQPTMASVLNLVNDLCLVKESVKDNADDLIQKIEMHKIKHDGKTNRLMDQIDQLPFDDNPNLLTYSNSSTVSKVIIESFKRFQWPERVLCSEGRPMQEGISLAVKLRQAGISVSVFTDAALMSQVPIVNSVWIGGDSLSMEGLVNKVGSTSLATLSLFHKKRFISHITSDKFLPPVLIPYFKSLPQNPREITQEDIKGIDVINEYYETVPFNFISYVFTEEGLQNPIDVVKSIENKKISQTFRDYLKEKP